MNTLMPSCMNSRLPWREIFFTVLLAVIICVVGCQVSFGAGNGSLSEGVSGLLSRLSFVHGWVPFLLLYLVKKTGYDRRALAGWFVICMMLCLASFWLLPPAGAVLADPRTPRNLNYVFGMDDMRPQQWIDPGTYVFLWITAFALLVSMSARSLFRIADESSTEQGII